jgi:hypothetical protein
LCRPWYDPGEGEVTAAVDLIEYKRQLILYGPLGLRIAPIACGGCRPLKPLWFHSVPMIRLPRRHLTTPPSTLLSPRCRQWPLSVIGWLRCVSLSPVIRCLRRHSGRGPSMGQRLLRLSLVPGQEFVDVLHELRDVDAVLG